MSHKSPDRPEGWDIIDAIRRADPLASGDWPPPRSYDLDELIARITATDPDGRSVRRRAWKARHRRVILVGVGVLLVSSAGVAVALVAGRESSRPESGVACRAEARLDSEIVVIEPGPDPIGRCATVWVEGRFDTIDVEAPPPLVACVGVSSAVEVFPGDSVEVCETLGLDPAVLELSPEAQAVIELQDRLVQAAGSSCIAQSEAVALARELIAELELDGWQVQENPQLNPTDICALVGVDSSQRSVFIGVGPQP